MVPSRIWIQEILKKERDSKMELDSKFWQDLVDQSVHLDSTSNFSGVSIQALQQVRQINPAQ